MKLVSVASRVQRVAGRCEFCSWNVQFDRQSVKLRKHRRHTLLTFNQKLHMDKQIFCDKVSDLFVRPSSFADG